MSKKFIEEKNKYNDEKNDAKMRVLANFLIDRFLDDLKNDRLKFKQKTNTLELELPN